MPVNDINIARFEVPADTPQHKSGNPHPDDTPTHGELTRRLYEEGIISQPADLEQTAETARDTLASVYATNGNHSIDDTEPHRKATTCGCSTTSDPLVKAINDAFDRIARQKQADDDRVKVVRFKVDA